MKFLTESARIAKAYGMVISESANISKNVCEGWSKPKIDIPRLAAAIESAKANGNDADVCPPAEVFGSVKEEGLPSFDAYVDERGNIILEEGLKNVDGNEHGEGHWIEGFDRKGYDASIDGFMVMVSRAYADASDDGDEVLEWSVADVLPNGEDRSYRKYVVTAKPYFIDWSEEYLGKDGKVLKRGGRFEESSKGGKCCRGKKVCEAFSKEDECVGDGMLHVFDYGEDCPFAERYAVIMPTGEQYDVSVGSGGIGWAASYIGDVSYSTRREMEEEVLAVDFNGKTYYAAEVEDLSSLPEGMPKRIMEIAKDCDEDWGIEGDNENQEMVAKVFGLSTKGVEEAVEDDVDDDFSKKVFFLDIRVPHPSDEDDETFEDMKYSATFTKLADAVETAKEAYAEYVKEYPEIEVNIWGGEERRPEGDIYGEPWVYCTVKADGCDFSDEQIAEEDAHDDYFLWRSEKAEKGDADVKESEEGEDEATIGNIDDMEDVEETETLTPEAERMVERDSVGWSNFGSNMPDNHVAFKNRLVVSSNYNNGIVGQSNLIAALKRLEEAGFKSGTDFGVLSAGGFGGHAYYLWYDRDNVKLANMLSGIEKGFDSYALIDEDLYSAMEAFLVGRYWDEYMDDGERADYYREHGEEVPAERPIPRPSFLNEGGDVTSMTAEQTLTDPDLREMAEEYGIELPNSYFE